MTVIFYLVFIIIIFMLYFLFPSPMKSHTLSVII